MLRFRGRTYSAMPYKTFNNKLNSICPKSYFFFLIKITLRMLFNETKIAMIFIVVNFNNSILKKKLCIFLNRFNFLTDSTEFQILHHYHLGAVVKCEKLTGVLDAGMMLLDFSQFVILGT